jgi:hypothetical protein
VIPLAGRSHPASGTKLETLIACFAFIVKADELTRPTDNGLPRDDVNNVGADYGLNLINQS